MTISDIFFAAAGGLTVAAIGLGAYALRGWHRRLEAYRAFQEQDELIRHDVAAYPFLKAEADTLAIEAKRARDAHKVSKDLSDRAVRARAIQVLCEKRLRAADIDPNEILREVA